nr:hypothetical protein [uncultured Lichenicoccus sp.]
MRRALPGDFWLQTDAGNHVARPFYERHRLRREGEAPHPHSGQMVALNRGP